MNKVYKIITDRFIEALEKDIIPWERPWTAEGHTPRNGVTGKPYTGINVLLLSMMYAFSSPFWVTYRQAKKLGGSVIEGETSTPIVFWKPRFFKDGEEITPEQADELMAHEYETRFVLRYYNVFNIEQCEDIDESKLPELPEHPHSHAPVESAELLITSYLENENIKRGTGAKACYIPREDMIVMPHINDFNNPENYYATFFHEMVHSTGHKSRLDRDLKGKSDLEGYSKEELVAEIGSAFLRQRFQFLDVTIENAQAYIKGWLKALKGDKGEYYILSAAQRAQKAVEYITEKADDPEELELETA